MLPQTIKIYTPAVVSHQHSNWLAVGWSLRRCQVNFLRIVLKTFDLFEGVVNKRPVVFVGGRTALQREPAFKLFEFPRRDCSDLIRGAFVCRQRHQVAENDRVHTVLDLSRVTVRQDRKSTRLNSSHSQISYAVFCLKKKKRT